jgi:hypothetical protein
MSLPDLLGVADVMARYGLRDRPAARKVMRSAGAFIIGGRLVIRQDDLNAHEQALAAATRRAEQPVKSSRKLRSQRRTTDDHEPLKRDWWRSPESDAA